MSYNSGLVTNNVTNVSLGLVEATNLTGTGPVNTTTTIGTVGAGKIWKIIYAEIAVSQAGANATSQILLNDVAKVTANIQGTAGTITNTIGKFDGGGIAYLKLTAGQTLKVYGNASAIYGHYNITYIEESV